MLSGYRPPRTMEPRELLMWYENITKFINDPTVEAPRIQGQIVAAQIADGAVVLAKFATSIRPVQLVSSNPSLPNGDYPVGSVIYNSADGKLYRNKDGTWTAGVAGSDVVNLTITHTQITDQLVAGQIAAGAVSASEISVSELSAISANMGTLTAGTIQQNYTAPGDNNTTPGAGLKITSGKIEAYGADQTFGGTLISSDGNYMVSVGKYLTATGLTKRYPLNNATNFTTDGRIHIYFWNAGTTAWVQVLEAGEVTGASTSAVMALYTNKADVWGVYSESSQAVGVGVAGGVFGKDASVDGGVGVWGYSDKGYGVKAQIYTNGKAPLLIYAAGSVPSHSAAKGAVWVDSSGDAFINVTGSSGYAAWRTLGVAGTDLTAYALAEGSMCTYYSGTSWYLQARINAAWRILWTDAP